MYKSIHKRFVNMIYAKIYLMHQTTKKTHVDVGMVRMLMD